VCFDCGLLVQPAPRHGCGTASGQAGSTWNSLRCIRVRGHASRRDLGQWNARGFEAVVQQWEGRSHNFKEEWMALYLVIGEYVEPGPLLAAAAGGAVGGKCGDSQL